MTSTKTQRISELLARAREFRFCGPSDDPDEQTAVTTSYHNLVVQLQRMASPLLTQEFAARLNAIEIDFHDIYSAYSARAEFDALLPEIESAVDAIEAREKAVARALPRAPLNALFVNHAADVLAETNSGMTGAEIVRTLGGFAIELNVTIPHSTIPFEAPNKRTALAQNLLAFSEQQRFLIIRELCDLPSVKARNGESARKLKLTLMTRYAYLDAERLRADVNEDAVMQARHWLDAFPEVLVIFNHAIEKYQARLFVRNLLDDLRLALEKLAKDVLGNSKPLEKQMPFMGDFVKKRGGSPELANMFEKLVDYFCKYQNNYVKHDDAVIEEEVEFIIDISSAFLKHFVRLAARTAP